MLLLATVLAAVTPGIRTPTGNIACFVSHRVLHCEIRSAAYRPRCTDLDWHGWEMTARGRVQITCSGGILYDTPPHYVTLAYGRSWHVGPFTCVSRRTGMSCRNLAGHALFVSRDSWSRR
jgi:hypothetical protein